MSEARARCGLALAALDQQAVDRGSWLLAGEVSLGTPPPFHSFALHRAPEPCDLPHSMLVDPRWAELFMTKLRDISDYQEKRVKLSSQHGRAAQSDLPLTKQKARPKERCKGRQQRKSKGEREECGGARAGRKLAMVASRQEDYDPAGKDGWEAVECYMTRWLLSTSTSLASFVRSFDGNGRREYQGMAADLLPAAAPTLGFLRRSRALPRELVSRRHAVNLIMLTLSWLHLGKSSKCPAPLSRFARLSEAQWKMVRRVEEHVADVLRVGVVGASETGRGVAKVLELQAREIVEDGYISQKSGVASNASGTSLAAGEVIGRMVGAQPVVAKAIETERLSLPSAPPSFDPTPLLPKRHREVFRDPVSLAEPVDPAVDRPPKVRVHAARAQVKELVKRLDAEYL